MWVKLRKTLRIGLLITTIPVVNFLVACANNNKRVSDDFSLFKNGLGGSKVILSKNKYNAIYDQIPINNIAVVIIANSKIYQDFIPTNESLTLMQLLNISKYEFKYHKTPLLGNFLLSFREKKSSANWMHGISKEKNYGDYYPFIFINHEFSQFGASNFKPEHKDVIELTYDYYN